MRRRRASLVATRLFPTPLVGSLVALLLFVVCERLPAWAASEPPDLHLHVEPVSLELGLLDLYVTADHQVTAIRASVREGPDHPAIAVSLAPPPAPDAQWSARVLLREAPGRPIDAVTVVMDADAAGRTFHLEHEVPVAVREEARVPAWALGATWYQVFPERFRNGDPANDPVAPDSSLEPWTSDFASVSVEEIELAWSRARVGERRTRGTWNAPGGARRAVIYNRRYGGDLQGFVASLEHLRLLSIDAVYFCPLFDSASLHKYDATDFRHIDPTFGPPSRVPTADAGWGWTMADRYFLDTVLPRAREAGLRVVLDGVWNHTGTRFWAFQDIIRHGAASPYASWFRCRFDESGALIGWEAWDGRHGNLPEFTQTPEGDLVEPVSAHIFDVTRRWMDPDGDGDPSDGIDGWRLDVAPEIGLSFWTKWRSHVRSINPAAALYGEIWFDAGPWFGGKAFDAQMNYPFASAVVEWASGSPRLTADALGERLDRVFSHHPANDLAQMNLLGSHDTARVLTMLARPEASYDDGATFADLGPTAAYTPPLPDTRARAVLALALQATYLGSPMVFAGDELGVFGADDPDCRKPLPWPDLGPWENPADAPDLGLLAAYQDWLGLRRDPEWGSTLRYGTVHPLSTGSPDVFAFIRTLNDRAVLVVLNRGNTPFSCSAIEVARSSHVVPPLTAYWEGIRPNDEARN